MNEGLESCLGCGQDLRAGSAFCARCGFRVGEHPDQFVPAPAPASVRPEESWHVLRGALRFFGALLAVSFAGLIVYKFEDSPWVEAAQSLTFSLITLGYVLHARAELAPVLTQLRPMPWARTALVLGGSTLLLSGYFRVLEGLGVPMLRATDDMIQAGWPLWSCYLLGAVQPALFEELAFRGIVLDRLQRTLGATEAWLVQGAMFSVLHLMPLIFPSHFVMGLVFGWLRLQSGSLYPGMLAHALWNGWVIWAELHP